MSGDQPKVCRCARRNRYTAIQSSLSPHSRRHASVQRHAPPPDEIPATATLVAIWSPRGGGWEDGSSG
jgi:hypothetical protein